MDRERGNPPSEVRDISENRWSRRQLARVAIALGTVGILVAACGDGNRKGENSTPTSTLSEQTASPTEALVTDTVEPKSTDTAVVVRTTETPSPETDYREFLPDGFLQERVVNGKTLEQVFSSEGRTFRERFTANTSGREDIWDLGGVSYYWELEENGQVVELRSREALFKAVFPENPEGKFPGYLSDRIKKSDAQKAMAYKIATDKDLAGSIDGLTGTGIVTPTVPMLTAEFTLIERGVEPPCGPRPFTKITYITYTDQAPYENTGNFDTDLPIQEESREASFTYDDGVCAPTVER